MPIYRITALLGTNVFLSGAAFAAMTPYRAIVGVDELGLSNAAFGLLMALNAVGSAFAAIALGWISDRMPDRRILVLFCAAMGVIAFALIATLRTPTAFVAAFCLLVPFGNALFSQSFSYSRALLDRERPARAELCMSYLRTLFTVAWIVVPPLAGWIAALWSAYAVFAFAAVAHVGCTLAIALLWRLPQARVAPGNANRDAAAALPAIRISRTHLFGLAGVTLSLAALQLNMVLLPLIVVRDLGGSVAGRRHRGTGDDRLGLSGAAGAQGSDPRHR